MKKILSIAIVAAVAFQCSLCFAQRPQREGHDRHHEQRPDITELVSDLSSSQKSKLETITAESKKRVESLRKQQKALRDSIGSLMDREGDQSKALFPLFDREAKLQAEISREMYTTKVRIDQILSADQRKELNASCKKHKKHKK